MNRVVVLVITTLLILLSSKSCTARAYSNNNEVDVIKFAFTHPVYNATISENSVGKRYIQSPVRMGVQLDSTAEVLHQPDIRFRIIGGDRDNYFKTETLCIDRFCFLLIRTRTNRRDVLNRERKSLYRLKVRALDRSTKHVKRSKRQSFALVVVQIEDQNDLSPWFDSANYDFGVDEDAALHSVIARVHAVDADTGINGEVFYSLVTHTQHFYIHPTSGEIILLRKFNFKRRPRFKLKVGVKDRGNDRSSSQGYATVIITVRPVNLHDPVMQINHVDKVVEHSFMNIYAIVKVTDEDEGIHGEVDDVKISVGDPDRNFRVIESSSKNEFLIGLFGNLDREKAPYGYNLTLNVTDKGVPPRWSSRSVRVHLMDFNDHTPSFLQELYSAEIKETALPNTRVLQLRASDTDWGVNAELRYYITSGNEDQVFYLNEVNGVLTTQKYLDAEEKTFYALTVTALDQGYGSARRQGSAKVHIVVLDENDNAPTLKSQRVQIEVDENEPLGFLVTHLEAQDADQGDNSFLSYTITNQEDLPFAINHFDGSITTTQVLDYDTQKRFYVINVRISDWGKPYRRQIECVVEVTVRNVNDNRPQFERDDCHGYVVRTVPVGTEIITVAAIDWDEGAKIKYRIVDGNSDKCFTLDKQAGNIIVNCDLTHIKSSERRLGIMANDGEHFSVKSYIDLKLVNDSELVDGRSVKIACRDSGANDKYQTVLAVSTQNNPPSSQNNAWHYPSQLNTQLINEHAPEILNKDTPIEIFENVDVGTLVFDVVARDKDFGFEGLLIYSLSSSNSDYTFSIDIDQGNVSVSGLLDRERIDSYQLNVTVCDLGQPRLCANRIFQVHIKDINDNAPVFNKSSLVFYLVENRDSNLAVTQVNAVDPDEGLNGKVSYGMLTVTEDFSIDEVTGVVRQTRALDRERQEKYELIIVAKDSSLSSPQQSRLHIYIDVLDINDNPPVFSRTLYLTRALEDLPVNTVLISVHAYDPDRYDRTEAVRYSLIADEAAKGFNIDSHTGAVRLVEALDFERRQVYNLTVQARDLDSPQLTATSRVVILVEDVDENYFPPQFVRPVVTGHVLENEPVGTYVMSVRATDEDAAGPESMVVYSIRGGDGLGQFSINSTGDILTARVLDRETTSSYWLTVFASDSAAVPKHARLEVYITIDDVNDNAPLASRAVYEAEVAEHSDPGTWVTQVTGDDLDWHHQQTYTKPPLKKRRDAGELKKAQRLHYSIIAGDPQALFHVGKYSGIVRTTHRQLDRELQNSFLLKVEVSDSGVPELTSFTWIRIAVLDINDCDPEFSERFRRIDIPYGPLITAGNLTITQMVAFDKDLGENSTVQYSIVESDSDQFSVDANSGSVRVRSENSLRPNEKHQLTIQASDGGQPTRSYTARLLVVVGDLVSQPIHAALTQNSVLLVESDPVGHLVALVKTNTSPAIFNIEDGNGEGMFCVEKDGAILLSRPLDRETTSEYQLNISVTNGFNFVYISLKVGIVDANDHSPRFISTLFEAQVSELTSKGHWLEVALQAVDPDQDSSLLYEIEGARNIRSLRHFRLGSSDGRVQLIEPLDSEVMTEHLLIVSVRDQSVSTNHRDYARFLITVLDENDHAPSFSSQLVQAQVLQTAAIGSQVTTVLASDGDRGTNGELQYSIITGNVASVFTIEERLGIVSVARSLVSVDLVSEYMLTVRATDMGHRYADLLVNVLITEPDNSPPRLEKSEYFVELPEDSPIGMHVLSLKSSCRSSVSYRLLRDSPEFLLNPGSGVLSLNSRLDHEQRRSYNLSMQAVSVIGETSLAHAIIHVLDINDNAPQFTNNTYTGFVSESALPDSPVWIMIVSQLHYRPLVVTAVDADSGRNGQLLYSMTDDGGLFKIDKYTGAIRVRARLDHEKQPFVKFSVHVTDRGRPYPLQAWRAATVLVYVNDEDDEPPIFELNNYTFTVTVPTYSGVVVGRVTATDKDSKQIRYILEPSTRQKDLHANTDWPFEIDEITGIIRVKEDSSNNIQNNSLYVSTASDSLWTVKATDDTRTSTASVQVTLTIAPSSGLFFSSDVFYAAVYENSSAVEMVVTLTVRGARLNEPLTFSALTDSSHFAVDSTSGIVRTTGEPLDREEANFHLLVVQVRSDFAGRSAVTRVNVSVTDVNDHRPTFLGRPYRGVVSSRASYGTLVAKVRAVDLDSGSNSQLVYSLSSGMGDGALFSVDPTGGTITWTPPEMSRDKLRHRAKDTDDVILDKSEYRFVVSVRDQGNPPLMSRTEVVIFISQTSQPYWLNPYHNITVSETTAVGTALLTLQATSGSQMISSGVVYRIINNWQRHTDRQLFDVDFESGVMYLTHQLDYELSRQHIVNVSAIDRVTGSSVTSQVTVHVTNANDNPPHVITDVSGQLIINISESAQIGDWLMSLNISDADNDLHRRFYYRVIPHSSSSCRAKSNKNAFNTKSATTAVNPSDDDEDPNDDDDDEASLVHVTMSGQILLGSRVDFERQKQYRLQLEVGDDGDPQLSSTVMLIVNVKDVNDNPPVFEFLDFKCYVTDQPKTGQLVAKVTAHDVDSIGHLYYRIVEGNTRQHFTIDNRKGLISIGNTLEFGVEVSQYILTVSVTDGVFMTHANLTVHIVHTNQHTPRFTKPIYSVQLSLETPVGSEVTQVTATDRDRGHLGHLTYRVMSPRVGELFAVNETSGKITTLAPLHAAQLVAIAATKTARETVLDFVVMATDGGNFSSHCNVHVVIVDTEQRAPQFLLSQYHVTVANNRTAGDVIASLVEISEGVPGGSVYYRILESNTSSINNAISIGPTNGDVILMTHAWLLENTVYQFFVRATNGADETKSTDIAANVLVLPVGAGIVRFGRFQYGSDSMEIPENQTAGSVLARLTVNMEGNVSLPVRIRLATKHDSPDIGMFAINDQSHLILTNRLDREVTDRYDILVAAETSSLPPVVAYQTITVHILDINDNRPEFDAPVYRTSISEDTAAGSHVLQVIARDMDVDANGRVTYRLLTSEGQMSRDQSYTASSNTTDVFSIDERSGWLITLRRLDREVIESYRLTIEATDSGTPSLKSHCSVYIAIGDVNDSPMSFSKRQYRATLPEDASTGSAVISLPLIDDDLKHAPQLRFYITDGDANDQFQIRSSASGIGEVVVHRPLDRETVPSYKLTILATDGAFTAESFLLIELSDVNDNGPVCPVSEYRVSVAENSANVFLANIAAFDSDLPGNSGLVYSLHKQHQSLFTIDQNTGAVYAIGGLDRESKPEHTLTIHVTGVRAINNQSSLPSSLLTETTDDADDEEKEEVEDDSCAAQISKQFSGCSCKLVVTVDDVNDEKPVFILESLRWSVPEDAAIGYVVGRVVAKDADAGIGGKISYSISDRSNIVSVDSSSGILTLIARLDRETQPVYNISIVAADNASPSLSTSAHLIIQVTDVNDNPPVFSETVYHGRISEDVEVGMHVLSVLAVSKDIGINAELKYSLIDDGSVPAFSIHPKTGVISVTTRLDRERRSQYVVTVSALDGSSNPLTGQATVNITVLDVNDCTPQFVRPVYHCEVAEDSPVHSLAVQVLAADADLFENGTVRYSLLSGNDLGHFSLNTTTGEILVASSLDREMVSFYQLNVTARDLGQPSLNSTVQVTIKIKDVNDNPPVFTQTEYSAFVQEGRPVGVELLHFRPTDADLPPNSGPFTFEIAAGAHSHAFTIDAEGRLCTAAVFDYHRLSRYRLVVRAYDAGDQAMSSEVRVNVSIIEEPRYPPVIVPLSAVVVWAGGDFPGAHIGRVHAKDQDIHDRLSYALAANARSRKAEALTAEVSPANRTKISTQILTTMTNQCHTPQSTHAVTASGEGIGDCDRTPLIPTLSVTENQANQLFSIDAVNGRVYAMAGLDSGSYTLNVTVSDGKFVRAQSVHVRMIEIDDQLEECAVIVAVRHTSVRHFTLSLMTRFRRVLRRHLLSVVSRPGFSSLLSDLSVLVLGVQPAGPTARYHNLNRHHHHHHHKQHKQQNIPLQNNTVSESEMGGDKTGMIEVLLAVEYTTNGHTHCLARSLLRSRLARAYDTLSRALHVRVHAAHRHKCAADVSCVHGRCAESLAFASRLEHYASEVNSFVAPPFVHTIKCECDQGYTGERCHVTANPCLHRPCKEFQICQPLRRNTADVGSSRDTDSNGSNSQYSSMAPAGPSFVCRCPAGTRGPLCALDVGEDVSCASTTGQCSSSASGSYGPTGNTSVSDWTRSPLPTGITTSAVWPVSFDGFSYLEYELSGEAAFGRRFSVALSLRTRADHGVLLYSAGPTEYNIVEIVDGSLRYRFNCGTGEGAVQLPLVSVSDNRWHSLRIERFANKAELVIDGKYGAHSKSPGHYEVVSVPSGRLFIGAEVRQTNNAHTPGLSERLVVNGLHGCVDALRLFDTVAPLRPDHSTPLVRLLDKQLDAITAHSGCAGEFQHWPLGGSRQAAVAVLVANSAAASVCRHRRCLNGGRCRAMASTDVGDDNVNGERVGERCQCPPRYTGSHCQIDTAPCVSAPCLNGGTCRVEKTGSGGGGRLDFRCECAVGFYGSQCQYGGFCAPNPCSNGARCEEGVDRAICLCRGFSGTLCDTDIDECVGEQPYSRRHHEQQQQQLGAGTQQEAMWPSGQFSVVYSVSRPLCGNGGTCVNTVGSYRCSCPLGWTGVDCNTSADDVSLVGGSSSSGSEGVFGVSAVWLLLMHCLAVLTCTVCACLVVVGGGTVVCRRWSGSPRRAKFTTVNANTDTRGGGGSGCRGTIDSTIPTEPNAPTSSCPNSGDATANAEHAADSNSTSNGDPDVPDENGVETLLLRSFKQQQQVAVTDEAGDGVTPAQRQRAAVIGHVQKQCIDRDLNRPCFRRRPPSQHKLVCVGIPSPQSVSIHGPNDRADPVDNSIVTERHTAECTLSNNNNNNSNEGSGSISVSPQSQIYSKPMASVAPSVVIPSAVAAVSELPNIELATRHRTNGTDSVCGQSDECLVAADTNGYSSTSLRRKLDRCNSAFIDNYSLFKPSSDEDVVLDLSATERGICQKRWRSPNSGGTYQRTEYDTLAKKRPLSEEITTSNVATFRNFGMLPGIVTALSALNVGGQHPAGPPDTDHVADRVVPGHPATPSPKSATSPTTATAVNRAYT